VERKRIDNPKRGCGHLKANAMYLRADTHPDGTLPAFVLLCPPVPYVERHYRGWKPFQGTAFCLAGAAPRSCLVEGDDKSAVIGSMTRRFTTDPPGDVESLLARLAARGLPADLGHADVAWAPDLIMWVGKDFYTVGSFIEEARQYGVNKRIPSTGEPPLIVPGVTRLFLAHPHACDGEPGVFGYTYLTRAVYTRGPKAVPKWVDDLAAQGRVDVCDIGPEHDPAQATPLLDGLGEER